VPGTRPVAGAYTSHPERGRERVEASPGAPTKGRAVSGGGDKTKGRIKEAVGDLTDDDELKREGKIDQASGKVKETVDKVKDRLTDDGDD
jgi:uncharacterized protein YjbJ (UPF0337 family)